MPMVASPTTPISFSGMPKTLLRVMCGSRVGRIALAFPEWGNRTGMEIDRRRIRRIITHKKAQERTLDRVIRGQPWLDATGEAIQKVVGGFYGILGAPGRVLKDFLHGT